MENNTNMKLHKKTFNTKIEAIEYKNKIKKSYNDVRIVNTSILNNEYGKKSIINKFQVRVIIL